MGAGVFGIELQGLFVLCNCVILFAGIVERAAQVHVGLGALGIELERCAVVLDGAIEVPPCVKHVSQVVVRVGVAGPQSDRLFELGDSIVITVPVEVHAPQVVVRRGIVRKLLDGIFVFVDRGLDVTVSLVLDPLAEVALGGDRDNDLLLFLQRQGGLCRAWSGSWRSRLGRRWSGGSWRNRLGRGWTGGRWRDRKSTRLNSSHLGLSYA